MSDSDKLKQIKEIITRARDLEIMVIHAINQIEDVVDGIQGE